MNINSWSEITRDERYFCAELFFEIRKDIKPFLELIGRNTNTKWDVSYEVCFYRDFLKAHGQSVKKEGFPQKRTWDLALFSIEEIIIIEAKAHQGFESEQLSSFDKDKKRVVKVFKSLGFTAPMVSLVGICSSNYSPSTKTRSNFDKILTWKELAKKYTNAITHFERADDIYGD